MDVELMAKSNAKRVNGFIKRSDRLLEREKRSFDTELKKRLNKLDGDMAKVKARGEQLKREKETRSRHLHIRRNSDCVDVGRLPALSANQNLVCVPRDVAGSAPDVRYGASSPRSRDSSPVRSTPTSRKNSVAPGLRETLLKSSIGLITSTTGSDVTERPPTRRGLLRAHSRSSSLPNMRATISGQSPSSSPSASPLMRRKSRKEAFISGGSSAASSRESSVDRRRPVGSRDSSRASSITRLVYCPVTDTLYGENDDEKFCCEEDDLYLTLLFPEWEEDEQEEAEDEVDQLNKEKSKSNTKISLNLAAEGLSTHDAAIPSPNQAKTSNTRKSIHNARSFRQLRTHAHREDGYRRRDVRRREEQEQLFMEETQGPESLADMFAKLKDCRYLRTPGECIDPKVDVDEIFSKK